MLTVVNPESFDWEKISFQECCRGNAIDAFFTLKLYYNLLSKLEGKPINKVLTKLMFPLIPILAESEYKGIDIDVDQINSVDWALQQRVMDIEDTLFSYPEVSKTSNLRSSVEVGNILYGETGFGLHPPKKTPTGTPCTDEETLKTLLTQIEEELEKRSDGN